eukprot:g3373.t1
MTVCTIVYSLESSRDGIITRRRTMRHQKKSTFQRLKEKREAKKRAEEREREELYAGFVASFDARDSKRIEFVKGGVENAEANDVDLGTEHATKCVGESHVSRSKKRRSALNAPSLLSMFGGEDDVEEESNPCVVRKGILRRGSATVSGPGGSRPKKKRREMDILLEEMKQRKESGKTGFDASDLRDTPGSFHDGDPYTTNIFVGNLPPTVTEEKLGDIFSEFGDIDSIKIMWPRTDEERARNRNSGFISFSRRNDAEEALFSMQANVIEGNQIRLAWGKAVPPSKGQPRFRKKIKRTATTATVCQKSAQLTTSNGRTTTSSGDGGDDRSTTVAASPAPSLRHMDRKIEVRFPTLLATRETIDMMATYVAREGQSFEKSILGLERRNDKPRFRFLFDTASSDHRFYRWRDRKNVDDAVERSQVVAPRVPVLGLE